MGLFIGSIVLIIAGFIIGIVLDSEYLGAFIASVGVASFLVIAAILIGVTVGANNRLIGYQQDKAIVSMAYNGKNITGEERENAIRIISYDNTIILQHRYWNKNFWIGWFYPKAIAKLELFDIENVSQANSRITIDKE